MRRSYYGWSRFWGVSNWDPDLWCWWNRRPGLKWVLGLSDKSIWIQSVPGLSNHTVGDLSDYVQDNSGLKPQSNIWVRGEKKVGRVRSSGWDGMVGTTFIRVPQALVSYIFPSSLCTVLLLLPQLYLPVPSLYSSTLELYLPILLLSLLYSCYRPLLLVSSCDAACFPHNFTLAVFCVHYEQVW